MVVVGDDQADPSDGAMQGLDDALAASGMDALAAWVPATDAIVRISDEHVVEHLDRAGLGRLGLPQVISAEAWSRFQSVGGADEGVLPANVVASQHGRVGTIGDGVLDLL